MESQSDPVGGRAPVVKRPNRWAVTLQIVMLVLLVPAIAWGAFAAFGAAFPSHCGDFSGAASLVAAESWLVDIPVGVLVLGVSMWTTSGSPALRKICIGAAAVTLVLPVVATALVQIVHCR